ncbi:unnamed protein product [Prorocentrum cordatum]|uniref:Uncharacterized protein n=1 Tax=Prorocentrum cordatum TaxID=2364126 RepID=A0ABN9SNH7_9DINO|nr:unnamed protein product [Polarella glacialis]
MPCCFPGAASRALLHGPLSRSSRRPPARCSPNVPGSPLRRGAPGCGSQPWPPRAPPAPRPARRPAPRPARRPARRPGWTATGPLRQGGLGLLQGPGGALGRPNHHPWESLTECVGLEDCKQSCLSSRTRCAGLAWSPRPGELNNCSLDGEPRCNLYLGDSEVTTTSSRWQEYTCYVPDGDGTGASWALADSSEDQGGLLGLIDRTPPRYLYLFVLCVLVAVLLYCCWPRLRRCCGGARDADEGSGREADSKTDAEQGLAFLAGDEERGSATGDEDGGHAATDVEVSVDVDTAGSAADREPIGENHVAVSVDVDADGSAAEHEPAKEDRGRTREDIAVSVDVETDAAGRGHSRDDREHASEDVAVSVNVGVDSSATEHEPIREDREHTREDVKVSVDVETHGSREPVGGDRGHASDHVKVSVDVED